MWKKYNTCTEVELLQKMAEDDKTAFAEIYRRYQKPLRFFAYTFFRDIAEVDDILQEVFTKLWRIRHRHEIMPKKSLKGYLYQMVRNKITDHFRSLSREHMFKANFLQSANIKSDTTEDMLDLAELMRRFDEVFEGLSKENQDFYRSYENAKHPAEVAQELGVSEKRVRNRYYALKAFIKEQLGIKD